MLDALDAILAEPDAPASIVSYLMRGTTDHVDRIIAELPHGWVLTYTPYPRGVPPQSYPVLIVRSLRRMSLGD